MSKIIEAFEAKKNLLAGNGADKGSILSAEKELNLTFAEEYKDYLKKYGIVAYDGHELTGIVDSPRVNVVDATKTERKNNPNITSDLYVIECTNIDEIVMWQSSDGQIMYSAPGIPPKFFCKSLSEYISKY